MPESITQSEKDHNEEAIERPSTNTNQVEEASIPTSISETQALIIWTPRFIVLFTLLLVTGLSGASLLTEGWLNKYYPAQWAELFYTAIALGCWITLLPFARSVWVRLGAIFSIIWLLFTGINFLITLLIAPSQTYSITAQIIAARDSALLGSCLCLSIAYTIFQRGDVWFFRLAPIIALLSIPIVFYFSPTHTIRDFENSTVLVILLLGVCTWWLRSSCWRVQPGPTFLLGATALLQWIFSIPFPHNSEPLLFFTLVLLLFSTLGALRILQSERLYARKA